MERDRNLDQSLKKFPLGVWCGAPDVLEDLVGVEEFPTIEQLNTAFVSFLMCG